MTPSLSTGALRRDVARLHTHLQRLCVSCCEGTTVTQCTVLTELSRGGSMTLAPLSQRIGLQRESKRGSNRFRLRLSLQSFAKEA